MCIQIRTTVGTHSWGHDLMNAAGATPFKWFMHMQQNNNPTTKVCFQILPIQKVCWLQVPTHMSQKNKTMHMFSDQSGPAVMPDDIAAAQAIFF